MKKNLITIAAVLLFIFICTNTFAQKKNDYVSEKGHWQLVSNVHDKKTVTVQFYTVDGTKIYEETLYHTKLNADRKKVRRQLYLALEDACTQWASHTQISSNDLIAKRK
jgi:hypothetical protein